MKIFILPVPGKLQPPARNFNYPAHNPDYGVEQDFNAWILQNPQFTTANAADADWHYLPVYWTRWHIDHGFAENGRGIDELQEAVRNCIRQEERTFTISQFDGGTLLNTTMLEFIASRTRNTGIDIPILCAPHRRPSLLIRKKFLATFNGSFENHAIRSEMRDRLAPRPDVVVGGNLPTRFYTRWTLGKQFNLNTLASYVALCPRGTSANSFRFFEAMQLGVAPCLVGDLDVRPFKQFIDWDAMSYYAASIDELEELLDRLDKSEALRKGRLARQYWKHHLFYGKWCTYVIKELEYYGSRISA